MDVDADHYAILGLPSGVVGARLSEKEISKAYRLKALELHPDKRPDDPTAHIKFQKLKTSYEVLKDAKARKSFDDLVQKKHDKLQRESQQDSKRRKMMSDLEQRERAAFDDPSLKAREEEEKIARKLKEEIARIRSAFTNKASAETTALKKETTGATKWNMDGEPSGLDKEKLLKFSWKPGEDYTAENLKLLFGKFGKVKEVMISSKKKGSALIVMASRDAAVAAAAAGAARSVFHDLSNSPSDRRFRPAQYTASLVFPSAPKNVESFGPKLSNIGSDGYQAFEDSVLEKLRKKRKAL